jgi:branched-chain amino acid transport system permease protein
LSNDGTLYVAVAVVFILALLAIARIVRSPLGAVLRAIRENEPRAMSLGYGVGSYQLAVFVLSALLAGLAGAMKAIVFQLASLTDAHWTMSGEVVLMTLVGGVGTLFGPLVGAGIVVGAEFYLAAIGSWVQVIEGGIFVACVLGFRAGLVGTLAQRWRVTL